MVAVFCWNIFCLSRSHDRKFNVSHTSEAAYTWRTEMLGCCFNQSNLSNNRRVFYLSCGLVSLEVCSLCSDLILVVILQRMKIFYAVFGTCKLINLATSLASSSIVTTLIKYFIVVILFFIVIYGRCDLFSYAQMCSDSF